MDKKEKEIVEQKAISMIQLARKAGKVKFGFDAVRKSCETGKSFLVLAAVDLAKRSRNRLKIIAQGCNVRMIDFACKLDYAKIFDSRELGLISIEDQNFARGIIRILDRLEV